MPLKDLKGGAHEDQSPRPLGPMGLKAQAFCLTLAQKSIMVKLSESTFREPPRSGRFYLSENKIPDCPDAARFGVREGA